MRRSEALFKLTLYVLRFKLGELFGKFRKLRLAPELRRFGVKNIPPVHIGQELDLLFLEQSTLENKGSALQPFEIGAESVSFLPGQALPRDTCSSQDLNQLSF